MPDLSGGRLAQRRAHGLEPVVRRSGLPEDLHGQPDVECLLQAVPEFQRRQAVQSELVGQGALPAQALQVAGLELTQEPTYLFEHTLLCG